MKTNIATLILPSVLLIILFTYLGPLEWNLERILGAAVAVISFPLFVLARLQLGSSFSITPQAKRLVTTGLYAKIRNPIYLFGGLWVC